VMTKLSTTSASAFCRPIANGTRPIRTGRVRRFQSHRLHADMNHPGKINEPRSCHLALRQHRQAIMPVAQTWEERNVAKLCKTCLRSLPVSSFALKRREVNLRHAHCRQCVSARNKADRPQALKRERAWAAANPEKRLKKSHREGLRKNYGMKPQDYADLLNAQAGRCAICKTDNSGRKRDTHFYVDHCHKTKKVRGLLCHNCNLGIGHLRDDISLVEAALRYLKERS
jgi:hypothetical protein